MNNSYRTAIIATAAGAFAALLLAPAPAQAQLPRTPPNEPRSSPRIMAANARQLTLFDRAGKEVKRRPERSYNQPVLSPDARRVAVIKADLEKETNDLWVLEVATGKAINHVQPDGSRPRRRHGLGRKPGGLRGVAVRPFRFVSKSFGRQRVRGTSMPRAPAPP